MEFCLDLYKQLSKRSNDENLFVSSFSILQALAMTSLGARNETAAEMEKVLRISQSTHKEFKDLNQLVKPPEKPEESVGAQGGSDSDGEFIVAQPYGDTGTKFKLEIANRIYVQKEFPIVADYLARVASFYQSQATPVHFTEQTRLDINKWVAERTHDKIRNLIPPGVFTADTRLVLINAIYFKAAWAKTFDEKNTKKEKFYLTGLTESVETDMMFKQTTFNKQKNDTPNPSVSHWEDLDQLHRHMTLLKLQFDHLSYVEDTELDCQAIWLSYVTNSFDSRLSMMIILPRKKDGLAALEEQITRSTIRKLWSERGTEKVRVKLPKFKIEFKADVVETLKAMGLSKPFDEETADFSGITGERNLLISNVIHQAFVDVNEKGTEAAAATAVVMQLLGCALGAKPKPPKEFIADHPFLFAILLEGDDEKITPLFMGGFRKPDC